MVLQIYDFTYNYILMARRADPDKGRIPHPDEVYAYLKERDGMWHGVYRDSSRSTHLKATKKNIVEAMGVLTDRIAAIKRGEADIKYEPTKKQKKLSDLIHEYARIHFKKIAERTKTVYLQIYKKYFVEDYYIHEVDLIRNMILTVVEQKKQEVNTVNHDLTTLNALFKHAVECGYCTVSPILTSMIPQREKGDIVLITELELEIIYKFLRNGKHYKRFPEEREQNIRFFRMLSLSAMRPGEAIKMTVNDIEEHGYRIDGKRSKSTVPRIRYFPKHFFTELDEVFEEQKNYSIKNNLPKLWSWNHYQKPGGNFRDVVRACNLKEDFNLYSLRKYALNRWEKELLIPEEVRLMLAGHGKSVKAHYFTQPNGAETSKIVEDFMRRTSGIRQE